LFAFVFASPTIFEHDEIQGVKKHLLRARNVPLADE